MHDGYYLHHSNMNNSARFATIICGQSVSLHIHEPYIYTIQIVTHTGRKLVGKPFVSEDKRIFCGDVVS